MTPEDNEMEKMLSYLIEIGDIEIAGVNEDGNKILKFTDKFIKENPEIVEKMQKTDSDIMNSLWFKGFIDVSLSENGDPFISLTDKSMGFMFSNNLNIDEKKMMYDIMSYINNNIN